MQGWLAAEHIQNLMNEADARRVCDAHDPGSTDRSTRHQLLSSSAYYRVRRRLGALLILAGRRLAGCDPAPAYQAYGSARR